MQMMCVYHGSSSFEPVERRWLYGMTQVKAETFHEAWNALRLTDPHVFDEPECVSIYNMDDPEERSDFFRETRSRFGGIPESPSDVITANADGTIVYRIIHSGLGRLY